MINWKASAHISAARALSVDSFIKKSSYIYYTRDKLFGAKEDIVRIAKRERLTAHANAITVRFED